MTATITLPLTNFDSIQISTSGSSRISPEIPLTKRLSSSSLYSTPVSTFLSSRDCRHPESRKQQRDTVLPSSNCKQPMSQKGAYLLSTPTHKSPKPLSKTLSQATDGSTTRPIGATAASLDLQLPSIP